MQADQSKIPALARIKKFELWLLPLIVATAILFHLILQIHAGAFWRDECSSILLARSKTWQDLFAGLPTDSFPALWVVLLRLWDIVGGRQGEIWVRSIGFWLSLGAIGAIWHSARQMKLLPPLLAMVLVVLNPTVFYWGDSLRAYALAMILVVLLFGFVWKYCEEGGTKHFFIAVVTAILAAQSNYQSSYLIFAICVAGALICLITKQRIRGLTVLGIGLVAAISMIPYRSVIDQYSKPALLISVPDVKASLLWDRFSDGFDSTISLIILLYLYLLCLVLPIYFWFSKVQQKDSESFRRSLYAAVVSLIAPIGCYFFARKAGFPTQSWYYIPILGLCGIAIEMSLANLVERPRVRQIRLFLVCVLILVSIAPLWRRSHLRRTTMDLVAAKLAEASPNDLILINPIWEVGSFQYYYKGEAPWSILPIVPDDQRGTPYVAMIPLMTSKEPLITTYDRIQQTLRAGGRVWVTRGLPLSQNSPPVWIPHSPQRGEGSAFMDVWAKQVGWFVAQHAVNRTAIPIKSDQEVSHFENIGSVVVFSGWKDSQSSLRN